MTTDRIALTVGIASPGDLPEERAAVAAACERFNRNLAPHLGVHLSIVMWEDQAPGAGRPQSLINERLDGADLLICLVFRRWGTPTGAYSSGFHEEFSRAQARRAGGSTPEIKLYFKDVDAASLSDPGPQLAKVLEFKRRLENENALLYGRFSSAGELEVDVYDALVLWIMTLRGRASDRGAAPRGDDGLRYRLARAVSDLPEREKIVFTLLYLEGVSLAEVAQALGTDEPTVHKALHDGLEAVQARLAREGLGAELESFFAEQGLAIAESAGAPKPRVTVMPVPASSAPVPAAPRRDPQVRDPLPADTSASAGTRPPLAQLKAWLPDPTRRIQVHDLVLEQASELAVFIRQQPLALPDLNSVELQRATQDLLDATKPLLSLVLTGVHHDREGLHVETWVAALAELLAARARPLPGERVQDMLERLRHYPALLLMRGAATVAVNQGRDDVLIRLLTEPTWRDPYLGNAKIPAAMALHDWRIFDPEALLAYPRFAARWHFPMSVLMREDLREPLAQFFADDQDYEEASDGYEYRAALVLHTLAEVPGAYRAAPGNFIGERKWEWGEGGRPLAEVAFQAIADKADDSWPWWQLLGGREGLAATLAELRADLGKMRRFG